MGTNRGGRHYADAMSFVVHFLPTDRAAGPHPLGDLDAAPASGASDHEEALAADEVATWDGLHPTLVTLLPPGSHDVTATMFSRQLVHESTGLMVTWAHDDYQASMPFWRENVGSGALDALAAITEAIESATGLVGVDEISEGRFLDHRDQVTATFAGVADGYEQAMEHQTVLGWLRDKFRR